MPFRTGGMRLVVMEMLVVMWVLALSKPAVIVQTLGEALTHASFTDIIAFAYLISHSLTDRWRKTRSRYVYFLHHTAKPVSCILGSKTIIETRSTAAPCCRTKNCPHPHLCGQCWCIFVTGMVAACCHTTKLIIPTSINMKS